MLKRSSRLLLLGCAALLNACDGCDRTSPPVKQAKPASRDIRTDLSILGKVINLPSGTRAGRLAVLPRGGEGLGPSDSVAYVYLELDAGGLKALEPQGGASAQAATLELPEDVARALLPPSLLPSSAPVNGSWSIEGDALDAESLGRMPYQVDEAIRVASGLVVIASTR